MFRLKHSLILLICLVRFDFCNPQQIKFKHLSEENGLSDRVINCAIEDHIGFLWFGTEDGLNRFDGYNFRVFRNVPHDSTSLSDNNIWALYEDFQGNIWAGTQGGILNCFNPATEEFKRINITSDVSLKGNSITCIYQESDDVLWIGTYKGGLYRLDINKGNVHNWKSNSDDKFSLSNKFVTSIYAGSDGNLWIGTYNGLCLFNKESAEHPFIRYYHNNEDYNSPADNIIWKIFPSDLNRDHIWICTYNGLTYLNTRGKLFTRIIFDKNNQDKFSRSISSVFEDFTGRQKYLWIGTYGGLVRIKLPNDLTRRILHEENYKSEMRIKGYELKFERLINVADNQSSINNNHINNIMRDHSGVVWISGQDGIDYYAPQKDKFNFFSIYGAPDLNLDNVELNNVQAICETGEKIIWIGTNSGIYTLENKTVDHRLYKLHEFMKQNIWCLTPGDNNDLWIGTYGNGLEHFELDTRKISVWKGNRTDTTNIGNAYVRAVCKDNSGNIWIGLWGAGLNRLNPADGKITRWRHKNDDPRSISYDDIWIIFEDSRDRIWIGTYGGGLNLFSPAGGGTFSHWVYDPYKEDGLSSNNILSICESSSNKNPNKTVLWVGTTNGLDKLIINNKESIESGSQVVTEHFLSGESIKASTINSIEEDSKGHLWLATNEGLIEFDPAGGIIETYTVFDGLKSNEFNSNAALKTKSGKIFLGSIKGLNIFYPDSMSHSDYKPPVVFTGFQVFNRDVPIGIDSPLKTSLVFSREIVLSHSQNVFSLQFAALDYNAPAVNRYAYKMEGFDKEWNYSGTRRFVTYTNLYPGKYIFNVKATNSDGIWNNSPTRIAIIITPSFWETWWFKSLVILILVGVLYLFYRIRLNGLLEMERLRIRIASDLHDDIGSALTRISLESELLNTSIDPEGRKEGLSRIGNMSREIISTMSDVVWSIDSRNDTMENLVNRMKDFSFSLFSVRNTRIVFETDNLNMHKKIKTDIRQNIYLIFKEAMNNSVKYSFSEQINVSLKNINGEFIMTIKDPAAEFSPQKLTGHGLRNMKMRAERIGGQIEFIKDIGLQIVFRRNEI